MLPDKEQFEELCAAHALGALDPEEQALFDETLANGDAEYQKIYKESIGISYLINSSAKRVAPSPLVKSKLLKRIQQGNKSSFSFSLFFEQVALSLGFGSPRFGLIVTALMFIVVAEIAAFAYFLQTELESAQEKFITYEFLAGEQEKRLSSLSSDLQLKEEILSVLQSSKIEVVIMNGQEVNPSGYGKIIWDPIRKIAILQVSKLPPVPSDKDYQLWFLDKDKHPVSAGVFNPGKNNENYFKVSKIDLPNEKKDITAFAVTIESKGGVPQPTGAMYLLGSPTSRN